MTRYRVDATVGIPLAVYLTALSLIALWLYSLLQPRQLSNPGLAAYTPPPATVINDVMPARLLVQHGQAAPLAEIESQPEALPEEPKTAVAESKPERVIDMKAPKRPKAPDRPWERGNPLRDYAAAYRSGGNRPYAAAYSGYSGNRPF